jgi:ABC-2 type transport system ATP-binding protein
MIEVDSLSRRYGSVTAVDQVSFTIGTNEVVGLLGHNGAGKTTVMRMLSGYLEPSGGSVEFRGRMLSEDVHAIQQQLGYLPENLPLYPDMMVADYLDYAATLKGIPRGERVAAVREALLSTDLAERALDTIDTLSRGFRQRVGVAQAILGRPGLLILDEPTNGLDPHQAEHMRHLIRRVARSATVILSTHIMQEVEVTCDRVLILRNGRLVLDQRLEALRESRTLFLRTGGGQRTTGRAPASHAPDRRAAPDTGRGGQRRVHPGAPRGRRPGPGIRQRRPLRSGRRGSALPAAAPGPGPGRRVQGGAQR